jgi:signal transduction histidine kinase/PAS domain-containing protein
VTEFTQDQQQLARAIGQQAAVAIDNARLYQEAQAERQKADRLITRAQSVYQVAMAVNAGAELPEVLEIATQHLTSQLGARSAVIALLENDRLVLANPGTRPHTHSYAPPLSAFPHCYSSIQAQGPQFVRHDKLNTAETRWFQQLGMNNILFVPLLVGDNQEGEQADNQKLLKATRQSKPLLRNTLNATPGATHCIGFAFVDHALDQKPPLPGYLAFAQDIAALCALAIDKARLLAEARQAMALSNERANTLNAIFNAMTEGILVLDQEGRVIANNNAAAKMLLAPLSVEQRAEIDQLLLNPMQTTLEAYLRTLRITTLSGMPIPYDDFPIVRGLRGELIQGERFLSKPGDGAGDERATEINVVPLLDNENKKIGIVSAFHDITEQIRHEQRLRSALTTMLHAAEAVSGILDMEEILQRVLQMSLRTLNSERGIIQLFDEETQTFTPLVTNGFAEEEIEPWLAEYNGQIVRENSLLQLKEGRARLVCNEIRQWETNAISHMMVLAAPITYNRHVLGVMLLDRSVSHRSEQNPAQHSRKRATRPLVALKFNTWDIAVVEGIAQFAGLAINQTRLQQEAEIARLNEASMRESNAQKDEILAITAHEFRTPLTVILAHSQMVARTLNRTRDINPQLKGRLLESNSYIEDQTRQLTNIVNTFLEVTRLNRGKLSLNYEPLDVVDLIVETIANHRATSTIHKISYQALSIGRPYLICGDRGRLLQVFANLLQNAIKYSPQGGPITFTIAPQDPLALHAQTTESAEAASVQPLMVDITIADQGIGVPLDAQGHLFECFYRAPNIVSTQARGVGLGLYVVSEFLHLHGGSIRVESSGIAGEGSRFIVSLPLK